MPKKNAKLHTESPIITGQVEFTCSFANAK